VVIFVIHGLLIQRVKLSESALAELEGGIYASATASGMAATNIVMELLPRDAHIIAMKGVYGGTWRLFEKLKTHNTGATISYIDLNDEQNLIKTIQENTALILIETIEQPVTGTGSIL
jgi:cystathionine gamma-lyase